MDASDMWPLQPKARPIEPTPPLVGEEVVVIDIDIVSQANVVRRARICYRERYDFADMLALALGASDAYALHVVDDGTLVYYSYRHRDRGLQWDFCTADLPPGPLPRSLATAPSEHGWLCCSQLRPAWIDGDIYLAGERAWADRMVAREEAPLRPLFARARAAFEAARHTAWLVHLPGQFEAWLHGRSVEPPAPNELHKASDIESRRDHADPADHYRRCALEALLDAARAITAWELAARMSTGASWIERDELLRVAENDIRCAEDEVVRAVRVA